MSVYLDLPIFQGNPRYNYQVDIGENVYQISIHWNITDSSWYMDLKGLTNTEDVKGIRLATGPNLLKPYAILDLGALYVLDGEELGEDPDFDEFGSRWTLFYTDDPAYII